MTPRQPNNTLPRRSTQALASLVALVLPLGCGLDPVVTAAGTSGGSGSDASGGGSEDSSGGGVETPLPEGHARVVHSYGTVELTPAEETQPCIQWTLDNEESIYINRVTITNDGGFHHSNWFVVPESFAEGEDGYFDCSSRGFGELEAALAGTVLTAQSTQSRFETMQLPEGVVVKAPPHHKIIAGGHLLNLSNDDYPTELRMELEIIHPKLVEVVTAPFRLSYFDLTIGPLAESRFSGECDFKSLYETQTNGDFDMTLYYVLPHYHYLGNFFDLSIFGGPRDGESVFQLNGFNASGNGGALEPPLEMTGTSGFSFTCGYNNWQSKEIGWGIGDQEMCVMLGLADSRVVMDASVSSGSVVGADDDITMHEGNCAVIGLPKNDAQAPPTAEEIAGEFYVPPSDPSVPAADSCVDAEEVDVSADEATLSAIRDSLFVSSCQFSSCHQGENAIAGLDLAAEDLHAELMGHTLSTTSTGGKLVEPGDPDASWLYQSIAKCDPAGDGSEPHMPLNSAALVNAKMIAQVRAWIEAGAPDN